MDARVTLRGIYVMCGLFIIMDCSSDNIIIILAKRTVVGESGVLVRQNILDLLGFKPATQRRWSKNSITVLPSCYGQSLKEKMWQTLHLSGVFQPEEINKTTIIVNFSLTNVKYFLQFDKSFWNIGIWSPVLNHICLKLTPLNRTVALALIIEHIFGIPVHCVE